MRWVVRMHACMHQSLVGMLEVELEREVGRDQCMRQGSVHATRRSIHSTQITTKITQVRAHPELSGS